MKQNATVDDGELGFDLRYLDSGDVVEVFSDTQRRWSRGRFEITTAGIALVKLHGGDEVSFDDALRAGLRRVVN